MQKLKVKNIIIMKNEEKNMPSEIYFEAEDGTMFLFSSHVENGWAGVYECDEPEVTNDTNY